MEEALIFQNDKHHKEKVKLTEAQIKQADNNNPNPNLEVIITQADKNTKTLVNTIKEANKPVEKPSNQEVVSGILTGFLELIKGEKGDKGEVVEIKGEKGENGKNGKDGIDGKTPTSDELKAIIKPLIPEIKETDLKPIKKEIIDEVKKLIPEDREISSEDLVKNLENLPKEKRLSYDNLKDLPNNLYRGASRDYDLTELKDVAISNPTNSQALIYNSTTSKWTNGASGASSPLTTKGDVYTYSTTDARLGVGTNGQVLTADSSQATGLIWSTAGGGGSGITRSVNVVSTNTNAGSIALTDYVYFCSGTINVTLPTCVGNTNQYTVKNEGVGTITVNTTSSQTIDGGLTAVINTQYSSIDLISNNSAWRII